MQMNHIEPSASPLQPQHVSGVPFPFSPQANSGNILMQKLQLRTVGNGGYYPYPMSVAMQKIGQQHNNFFGPAGFETIDYLNNR